jgi:DNA polymerase-3 subunit delta
MFRILSPVVVTYGEEPFLLDRDLDWYRKYPKRDITFLDGSEVTDDQVVSACESVSIDFDDPEKVTSRLVVVDNVNKIKSDKRLKAYLNSLQKGDLNTILAVVSRTEKIPALWSTLLPGISTVREFKKLKTWDNNNEVVNWTMEEAKRLGFTLELESAKILFAVTGGDLYRINNELKKLFLLVGKGNTAGRNQVQLVASRTHGVDPWSLVDSALAKDKKGAMNGLNLIYKYASEDPSILLLASLMKGVEKVFLARSLLDKGKKPEEVASRLGMHPFRFQKTVLVQAGKHSVKSLASVMKKLAILDVELKRTAHRRTLMELAVLELSG